MRFLPKDLLKDATRNKPEDLPVAVKVDESEYECDTSKSYRQRSIRVFYKQLDADGDVSRHLKECFNQLVERVKGEEQSSYNDDTGSLSGSVVDFSANMTANVNICTQSPIKSDVEDAEEERSPVARKRTKYNNNGSFYESALGRIGQS